MEIEKHLAGANESIQLDVWLEVVESQGFKGIVVIRSLDQLSPNQILKLQQRNIKVVCTDGHNQSQTAEDLTQLQKQQASDLTRFQQHE